MSLVFQRFQKFVEQHSTWYQGFNAEPLTAIRQAEQELQVCLPATFQWLLTHYGYWRATGAAALTTLVALNQKTRSQFPATWLILGREHSLLCNTQPDVKLPGNSGASWIILLCDERPSYDGAGVLVCDTAGHIHKRYSGYSTYSMALQQAAEKFTVPAYVACLPGFHRNDDSPLQLSSDRFDLAEFQQRLQETILLWQYRPADLQRQRDELFAEADGSGNIQDQPQLDFSPGMRNVTHWQEGPKAAVMLSADEKIKGFPAQTQAATLLEKMAALTRWKRQQIHLGNGLIPPANFASDSSCNRQLQYAADLKTGQLLALPCDSQGLLHEELATIIQPVCLLQSHAVENIHWLIGWVPNTEIAELQLKMLQWYQLAPCWLMAAGESLSELPDRLTQLQNG